MHSREYTSTDVTDCLDNICPKILVMVRGGDVTDSDCTSRAYPKYQQDADNVTSVRVRNRQQLFINILLTLHTDMYTQVHVQQRYYFTSLD